jgi:hypothetical protein
MAPPEEQNEDQPRMAGFFRAGLLLRISKGCHGLAGRANFP